MSNKSRLQTNNTNLQALIDKANALPDTGGGESTTLEWISVASLPQTYVVMPDEELSYYYYEVPEGCIGVVGSTTPNSYMGVSYRLNINDSFNTVSVVATTGEKVFSLEDADDTGTILKIGKHSSRDLYILPLYSPT